MKYSLPLFWEHFNYRFEDIEKNVSAQAGSYQGISSEALYTSDDDLLTVINHSTGTFADLGCGTGRAPALYAALFPDRSAIGIEFEDARLSPVKEFKAKFNLTNLKLLNEDLLSCPIPEADTYFLYFPTGPVLDRILFDLFKSKRYFRLISIESHGDFFPRLELENWLTLKEEVPLKSPRHHSMMRVYERNSQQRSELLAPFNYSFTDHFLLIEDNETWIGETRGLEWTEGDRFELQTPPRTISWKHVKKLMLLSEIDPRFHTALKLRRLGEVKIRTRSGEITGFIRKIIVHPSFRLEISNGEKVEWEDILTIFQGMDLCYESLLR